MDLDNLNAEKLLNKKLENIEKTTKYLKLGKKTVIFIFKYKGC